MKLGYPMARSLVNSYSRCPKRLGAPTGKVCDSITRVGVYSDFRMMKTIKKWKKERSTAKHEWKESQKKIQPLERAMNQKIDEFIENENAKFDKKHAKLLEENKELRKKRLKAGTQWRAAQMRMAVKHGFVRIRHSRVRRRSRRHSMENVEDMME